MLEDSNVATVVGLASVVLAFVSILVSILGGLRVSKIIREQVHKFDEVSGSLDRQLQSLSAVEGNLTTRPVGAFPEHIEDIVSVIKTAKSEILIACNAGYGASTAFELYTEYMNALRSKAANGVRVRILIPSDNMLEPNRNAQFDSENWADYCNTKKMEKLRSRFAKEGNDPSTFSDWKVVRSFLDDVNDESEQDLRKFADVQIISSLLQINCWVADGESAVFAIKSFEETFYSYAFTTRDKHMISALRAAWSYTKNRQATNGSTAAHEMANSS